ncbi:unnamed protein product [Protopolystoma xenopodis]|uniref:DNA polymerase epsilon catalytic subunit n=1 Tax=Protopolystoma xenopodis TaxID=117903 RepID=A0A3S4ZV03_9PLAT|nr:unnamed protein product [Protopolystoma xenopodis]
MYSLVFTLYYCYNFLCLVKLHLQSRQLNVFYAFQVSEINRSGFYQHVCVDLDLCNLAVNTLLMASRVPELEGASVTFDTLSSEDRPLDVQLTDISGGLNLGANITSYDETAASGAAFRVLRSVNSMVAGWVKDVTHYGNALADEQIVHFYQWLRSPRSLLYDPALRRSLQKLMKKVYVKLVDELRHLHVDVLHASFNRLVVCSRRTDLASALARVDNLTRLLRGQPLFSRLDIQYANSWRRLIWMDQANYAGIKVNCW